MQQHRVKLLELMPGLQKSKTPASDVYSFSTAHKEIGDIRDFDFRSDTGQRLLRAFAVSGLQRNVGENPSESIHTATPSPTRTTFSPVTPMKGAGGMSSWTSKTPLLPGHYSSPMPQIEASPAVTNFSRPPASASRGAASVTPVDSKSLKTADVEPLPVAIAPAVASIVSDNTASYASMDHKQRRKVYSILKAGFDQFTPAHLDDLAGKIMEAKDAVDVRNTVGSVRCEPEFPIISFLIDAVLSDPGKAHNSFFDQEPADKVLQLFEVVKVHERHHGQAQRAARLLSFATAEGQIHDVLSELGDVGASAKDTLAAAVQLLVLGIIRKPAVSTEDTKGKERVPKGFPPNTHYDRWDNTDLYIPTFAVDVDRVSGHTALSNTKPRVSFANTLNTRTSSEEDVATFARRFQSSPVDHPTPSRRGEAKQVKQGTQSTIAAPIIPAPSRRSKPTQREQTHRPDNRNTSSSSYTTPSRFDNVAPTQLSSDHDVDVDSGNSSMFVSDTEDEAVGTTRNEQLPSSAPRHQSLQDDARDCDLDILFKDFPKTSSNGSSKKHIAEDLTRAKKPSPAAPKELTGSTRTNVSTASTISSKRNKPGPMPQYDTLKKAQLSGKDFKGQYYTITRSQSSYTLPAKNINIGASKLSDLHLHTNTINNIQSVYQYSNKGWIDVSEQYYGHYDQATIQNVARHPVHKGLVLTTVPSRLHPTYVLERTYLSRQG